MVIVTKNQYLLASKIHHISLDENLNHYNIRQGNKTITKCRKHYTIHIIYVPDNATTSSSSAIGPRSEVLECHVNIMETKSAHEVFRDIIQQIREQMPDQMYLDSALEKLLAKSDLDTLSVTDPNQLQCDATEYYEEGDEPDDGSTKKVRKSRKKKRRNKKVSRRASRSNRRRTKRSRP